MPVSEGERGRKVFERVLPGNLGVLFYFAKVLPRLKGRVRGWLGGLGDWVTGKERKLGNSTATRREGNWVTEGLGKWLVRGLGHSGIG